MGSDMPTTAWMEAQVDKDGLALTLVSEWPDGTTVEEANYYTFAELQDMSGDMFSLGLTDETQATLGDARRDVQWARAFLDDMADSGESDKTDVPSETADESDESDESAKARGATPTGGKERLTTDVDWDDPVFYTFGEPDESDESCDRQRPQSGDVCVDTVTETEVRVMNIHENETAAETRAIGQLAEPKDMMVAEESANSDFPDDDPVALVSTSDMRCYYVPVSRLAPRSTDQNA